MTPMNDLRHQADTRPEHTAFAYQGTAWSYRKLQEEVDRMAGALLARGVRPGDRIAMHLPNSPEVVIGYYACFNIGAIAAPLNLRFKGVELRRILERLQPALYLGEEALYTEVEAIEAEILPHERRFVLGTSAEYRGARPWAALFDEIAERPAGLRPDPDAPAIFLTTSGTTGDPKFATHTPATIAAMIDACGAFGLNADEIVLHTVPMVHLSGFLTLVACIHFGTRMTMMTGFDADAVLDAIEADRCSWLFGLPFMFGTLLEAQSARPRDVGSLRLCCAGGDVCPIELQQRFPSLFGTPLRSIWGMTETMGSLLYGLRDGPVCRIAPGAQVRLVNEDGTQVERGTAGEMLIRGPNVSVGYWTGPGRIEDPKIDGWLHTGDLMRQGDDDELWFVSRKKDLIIRGGSNIAPAEVENILMAHPLVQDTVVVGVPDTLFGQRVAALVLLVPGADDSALDDIHQDARGRLANYKVPEWLIAVDEIPRNPLGKADRSSLTAIVLERRSRQAPAAARRAASMAG